METTKTLPADLEALLLKLRKGMAASLDAKKTTRLFEVLQGFTMTKITEHRPSFGGWFLKEVVGKTFHRYTKAEDGRIHYEATVLNPEGSEWYELDGRAEDMKKQNNLKTVVYPALVELSKIDNPKAKWMVRNVEIKEYVRGDNMYTVVEVVFDFLVKMNINVITTADGQTFEVYGDYKNGSVEEKTFPQFFAWADENTDIMEQILALLNMEPHEKKSDANARYVPPPTASKETIKVWGTLVKLTEGIRAEQLVKTIERYTNMVNDYMDAIKSGDTKRAELLRGFDFSLIIQSVWDSRNKKLEDDWQNIIVDSATKHVDHMQNMFVAKNTRKLAAIVTAKAKAGAVCTKEDVVSINADWGVITATINYGFADGSSFTVVNNVVEGYSCYGRQFFRFPTTFHDVVLPGGAKMSMPSEERMNEVFCKTTAE